MYLWKCWRDTRTAFLAMAGGILFSGALGVFLIFDFGGWRTSQGAPEMWLATGHLLVSLPIFVVPLAGFFLGACGVGEELGKGSSAFLMTRPRTRRYFLWVSWLVGVCQIVAILFLALLLRSVRWLAPPHQVYPGPTTFHLGDIVRMAALALVIYSLTFFFTTVLRSGRRGSNVALATAVIYATGMAWVEATLAIQLPPVGFRRWFGLPGQVVTDVLPWIAVTMILVFAAQVHFDRAEA